MTRKKVKMSKNEDICTRSFKKVSGGKQRTLFGWETEKPYLRRELNPAALAALVGCSVAELREAIQYHHGGGFYPFVGRYRLAEAQRLLQHPDEQRYTIEGLALQCGYASRSAFYRAFKEATGMTPAEFRRNSQKV
ncbi:MAG: AraC family transcriptional regulator [Bacteroidetes bacterium]|nr:AraC family transcriptional regulator [Bacteroidota bacterium]